MGRLRARAADVSAGSDVDGDGDGDGDGEAPVDGAAGFWRGTGTTPGDEGLDTNVCSCWFSFVSGGGAFLDTNWASRSRRRSSLLRSPSPPPCPTDEADREIGDRTSFSAGLAGLRLSANRSTGLAWIGEQTSCSVACGAGCSTIAGLSCRVTTVL